MRIDRIGFHGRGCLLLGAGATRGAAFVEKDGYPLPYPPLDADFFTQIQRVSLSENRDIVRRLLRFTVDEFGVGFTLTMERFFTQVEALPQVFQELRISRGQHYRQPAKAMLLFKQALACLFSESLYRDDPPGHRRPKTCGYHNRLVGMLDAQDAVISFNYDCVLEESLRLNCKYWNPTESYQLPRVGGDMKYWRYQVAHPGRPIHNFLPVLKMHGSMNWRRRGKKMLLTRSPYDLSGKYEIVPPQWQKDVLRANSPFLRIWQEARRRLERARCLIVVGYSAPMTDLLAQTLLRCRNRPAGKTLGNNYLAVLAIANPDREARRNLVKLFAHSSINEHTQVLVFDSLKQCAEYLVPVR
jgi:SIR2-like protein